MKCGDFTDKISISKISTTDISVSFFDPKKELIRPSRGFEFNFTRRRRPVLSNRRTSIPPSIHFNIITKKVRLVLTEKIRSGESTCQNSVKKFGRLVHIAYVYTCIQPGDACFSLTRRNLFAQSLSDQRVKRAPGSYLLAVHFRVYRPRGYKLGELIETVPSRRPWLISFNNKSRARSNGALTSVERGDRTVRIIRSRREMYLRFKKVESGLSFIFYY